MTMTAVDLSWINKPEDIAAALAELDSNDEDTTEGVDFLAIVYNDILEAEDLAALLTRMYDIEKIVILGVTLEGDLSPVAAALAGLSPLTAVELNCKIQGDAASDSMSSFGTGLGSLKLKSLRIHSSMSTLLASLANSPSKVQSKELAVMFDNQVSSDDLADALSILEHSKSLTSLKLAGPHGPYELKGDTNVKAFCQLVQTNASLTSLEATFAHGVSMAPIAESLKHNTVLEHLKCNTSWTNTSELNPVDVDAFYNLMRHHNFSLRNLQVMPRSWGNSGSDMERKIKSIDFLCAMNRVRKNNRQGRGAAYRQKLADTSKTALGGVLGLVQNRGPSRHKSCS